MAFKKDTKVKNNFTKITIGLLRPKKSWKIRMVR